MQLALPPCQRIVGMLVSATAAVLLVFGVAAATSFAGTVAVTGHIQGAGSMSSSAGGPYSCFFTGNQDDRVTADCQREAFGAVFNASVTLVAAPASLPAGHWRFLGWAGCDAVSGTSCTVTSGPFTLDEKHPKAFFDDFIGPSITSGPNETYSTVTERFVSFTFAYNEGVTTQCRVDSGAFVACSSGQGYQLSEGGHTFDVRAFDASGNPSATASRAVRIIDTGLSSGPAQGSLTNSRAARFTYSSIAGTSFECSLDFAPFSPCPNSGIDYAGLSDGGHTFQVRARDGGFFDRLPLVRSWNVDATPPDTALAPGTGPAEGSIVTLLTATFAFSSSEAGSTFQCRLDAAAFSVCTTPQALTGIGAGVHSFDARAIDPAGNVDPTPARRTWTVAPPDADGDGFNAVQDCNDNDASINPSRPEILDNEVDENCDGTVGVDPDRDKDGVQRPADCDDQNAAIRPGAVDKPANGVDEDCDGADTPAPPPPAPVVVAGTKTEQVIVTLSFFATAGARTTRFTTLQVKNVPLDATVTVTCKGKGCPKGLTGRGFVKSKAFGTVSLKAFIKKPLRAGIAITVIVSKPGAINAVKILNVRAGKKPQIVTRCLPPGATKPVAC